MNTTDRIDAIACRLEQAQALTTAIIGCGAKPMSMPLVLLLETLIEGIRDNVEDLLFVEERKERR